MAQRTGSGRRMSQGETFQDLAATVPAQGESAESGTIYLIPTPIGNIEDITIRALRVLGEVDLVACEDTRRTGKLLERLEIKRPLLSYHEHNESRRAQQLVERAQAGDSIAVVTDAGTPGIADPGYRVLQAAIAAGVPIVALPGPNAAIAALSVAGLPAYEFTFKGFLPRSRERRRKAIRLLRSAVRTTVFYETPHRIAQALEDIRELLGDRQVVAVRELTKAFEEVLRGTAASLLETLQSREGIRGEFVLLIGPAEDGEEVPVPTIADTLGHLQQLGLPDSKAIDFIAAQRGMSAAAVRKHLRYKAHGLKHPKS